MLFLLYRFRVTIWEIKTHVYIQTYNCACAFESEDNSARMRTNAFLKDSISSTQSVNETVGMFPHYMKRWRITVFISIYLINNIKFGSLLKVTLFCNDIRWSQLHKGHLQWWAKPVFVSCYCYVFYSITLHE